MKWACHVAGMGADRIAFKILTGTPTEKTPLGRPSHRLENNYQSGSIRGIGVHSAREVVNAELNLRVP